MESLHRNIILQIFEQLSFDDLQEKFIEINFNKNIAEYIINNRLYKDDENHSYTFQQLQQLPTPEKIILIGVNGLTSLLPLEMHQYDVEDCFRCACECGHLKLINMLIQKGTIDWNEGLRDACYGGHLEIVNLMIQKGANNWDNGLIIACKCGHLEMVNLMIQKGATNWNDGLWIACCNGHSKIVNLLIQKGATRCDYCNKSISEHLLKK